MATSTEEIHFPIGEITLTGDLAIPDKVKGIVVFAHGSGSSRLSSRNKFVAQQLQESNFATLLFDLLTIQEDRDYTNRFDIEILTSRLTAVTDWLKQEPRTADLRVGYFGASTGAAAALRAAAALGDLIGAVVSRGGRPDMAGPFLQQVKTPTLLIIGSLDKEVITLNEQAFAVLRVEKEIKIVPGAGHLFEEPGNLEEVAALSIGWFEKHLVSGGER